VRCPHCSGSRVEQYKTRTYTEREQQGAHWVVRVREVKLPCQTCDGVGQVGGACRTCFGRGVRSIANPDR
jgi:DnaJ-class molecular chaperone